MRELNFRVYDVEKGGYINQHHNPIFMDCETGKIYLVDYASPDPKNLIQSMENLPADKFIVEQFTGLKDKNGKEIYEGDIVRYWSDNYEVKFDDIEDSDITYYYLGWAMGELSLCESASMCEVIGNVHENPELLKNTK